MREGGAGGEEEEEKEKGEGEVSQSICSHCFGQSDFHVPLWLRNYLRL